MNALAYILCALLCAEVTVEDSFRVEHIRNAVLAALGQRDLRAEDVNPDDVRYLHFSQDICSESVVPVNLLAPFTHLRSITAGNVSFTGMDALSQLEDLRALVLWDVNLDAPRAIPSLRHLTYLTMRAMSLTDGDMAALSVCQELRFLDLRNNEIVSLRAFKNMERLERLDVCGNPVSSDELLAFAAERPTVRILSGARPAPDQYVRRAWLSSLFVCERNCLGRIIGYKQQGPWKGHLPWIGEAEQSYRLLDSAGEMDYYAGWAAVIVRYAVYFRGQAMPDYHFQPEDPYFAWFRDYTEIPPNADGVYSLDHVVQWIGKHKDSDRLPPSLLLDDMLDSWFDTE
ncbi:MAG TPA: hypothetical protein PKL84_10200 [Candidatus Hydrogenedentes bacterium]|nr:hypothetical protein [Candidatus Hydrogenedentota bacterium]